MSVNVPWFTPWDVDRITDAEPFDVPEIKQLECGGPPAQVKDTGLLNPSIGFSVILYVAVLLGDMVIDAGDALSVKSVPVPLRFTICVCVSPGDNSDPKLSSVKVSVALCGPAGLVGVKTTVMVQKVLTASCMGDRGQLSLSLNSVGLLLAMLLMSSGAVPIIASVNDVGTPLVVTGTPPNGTEPVDRLTTGNVAVPLKATDCILPDLALLLSVNTSMSLRCASPGLGTKPGVKVIPTTQLLPTGRIPGFGQLLIPGGS